MIKRIQLVRRRADLLPHEFDLAWLEVVARRKNCSRSIRPLRTVVCTALHQVAGVHAPHDGMSMEWFSDLDALRRFEGWVSTHAGATDAIEPAATVLIIAGEVVMRGVDWLERRWIQGDVKYKHMALARRAEQLSATEFSLRWRNRPGKIGGSDSVPVIAIPDEAKGLAYVQNHPISNLAHEWTYDAINEVYFDDIDDMRARIDFFRDHAVGRADADLVSEACFVAVAEHLIDVA